MIALLLGGLLALSVKIVPDGSGWKLLRDGKPYYVRGAAGDDHFEELVKAGGNSFRTWGTEHIKQDLDRASSLGLTVCAGYWLAHGEMNYSNAAETNRQEQAALAVVRENKNHSALLFWAMGNEMEGGNNTPALWTAVGKLVKRVKEIDPNHPVMTVVAEVNAEKIELIKRYAPDLDLIGINSYAPLATLPARLREFGWTKPYVVTEFGPRGHWESPKTAWGAPIEPTSTEKSDFMAKNAAASITGQPGFCLGSFAFLWGHKQEMTPTWFGLFLPSGEPLEAVDAMQEMWTGKPVAHHAPRIRSLVFSKGNAEFEAGRTIEASLAMEPGSEAVNVRWEVRREIGSQHSDGNGEADPSVVTVDFQPPHGKTVSFSAPSQPGMYRLYVVAKSYNGKAAAGNLPFLVR